MDLAAAACPSADCVLEGRNAGVWQGVVADCDDQVETSVVVDVAAGDALNQADAACTAAVEQVVRVQRTAREQVSAEVGGWEHIVGGTQGRVGKACTLLALWVEEAAERLVEGIGRILAGAEAAAIGYSVGFRIHNSHTEHVVHQV